MNIVETEVSVISTGVCVHVSVGLAARRVIP
jgi:hypothetical protein